MRLLRVQTDGSFSLTKDLIENIPPYAILSHTWGEDDQEVTFHDIQHQAGRHKQGYQKLQFCCQQTASNGLQYFWVDTCCIDKSNNTELSEAINSMFRWYQNAAQCFVYLPDVSKNDCEDGQALRASWKLAFRKSRWFTRGWTLQELLAPKLVTFFSAEGQHLGDKASLETLVHEITGIPIDALQGKPLSVFSIQNRLSWQGARQAKRAEDLAYSLFGIFDVHLPLIYGEGEKNAFIRLQQEVGKKEVDTLDGASKQCISDLRVTDPRDDKKRTQDIKGGLIQDSYIWVLENPDFCQWRDNKDQRFLWIKGDPGKGKTMLLCGIIDHLEQSPADGWVSSYFFLQATDERINTAMSVVRGLIFMLLDQDASLVSHLKKKYDIAGKALFEDTNSWQALSEIFAGILQDTKLQGVCLMVDALDECVQGLPQLLDLMVQTSRFHHTKWLVSSRNWVEIEEKLCDVAHRLSLELNAKSVSAAVKSYIEFKVSELTRLKSYQKNTADEVRRYLSANANNTFLWVSLVCQKLRKVRPRHTQDVLESFPPGLDSLYERMMEYISSSDDADACREILALVSTVYRPVSVDELQGLTRSIENLSQEEVLEVIAACGSFLTLRDSIIFFVHQSAKDFLLDKASDKILCYGIQDQHFKIFANSLDLLGTLKRDIYDLRNPGYPISQVKTPSPDPLASIRYSCVYWVDHLQDAGDIIQTGMHRRSVITDTLRLLKTNYLYWLEALSLIHSIPEGVKAIQKLERVLDNSDFEELQNLAKDARRFLLSQKGGIELAPLQTYTSALIFSPTNSLVKRLFHEELPFWVDLIPKVETDWNNCLQTLEGHSDSVKSVAISYDGRRLVSGSGDNTIKLWDAKSGACLQTLEGHADCVWSVAISIDGRRLVSSSNDKTVKLWDVESGACLQTLKGHSDKVGSVAISAHGHRLVSGSNDNTVKLWDSEAGACLQTLKGHSARVISVAISTSGRRLASGSGDNTVKLWDAVSGACLQTLNGHSDLVLAVAISTDGRNLVSGSYDETVKLWDAEAGACLQTLKGHGGWVYSVAISTDSRRLVSGSNDNTIKLWDADLGVCLQTLEGHSSRVLSVAISTDGRRLVSGSDDNTIKLWDAEADACLQMLEGHSSYIYSVAISTDGRRVVSGSVDNTIKLWDAESGVCLQTFEGHSSCVYSVAVSTDGRRLVSGSGDMTVKLWDAEAGACLQTLEGHASYIYSVAISTDGRRVVSGSNDNTLRLWDAESGDCLQTLKGHFGWISYVGISTEGRRLVSGSNDNTIKLWDADLGVCLQTLEGHSSCILSVAISTDGRRLASGSDDKTVKLWDAESGDCLQTLDVSRAVRYLSFDPDHHSRLLSDVGDIILDPSFMDSTPLSQGASLKGCDRAEYDISADNLWITYEGDNLIWLPPDYRPSKSRIAGSTIAIGCGSGRVWVIRFAEMELVRHKKNMAVSAGSGNIRV